jgi:hypothetical protein
MLLWQGSGPEPNFTYGGHPMVERVSDKASRLSAVGSQPSFEPADYQIGAEIKQLRVPKTNLVAVDWQVASAGPPPKLEPGPSQSQRHRSDDHNSDTPEERAASIRNDAAVKDLFPGKENHELRDAAYRYLMHRECTRGYPNMADEDLALLQKNGAIDKLEALIEQHRKQGLLTGACLVS